MDMCVFFKQISFDISIPLVEIYPKQIIMSTSPPFLNFFVITNRTLYPLSINSSFPVFAQPLVNLSSTSASMNFSKIFYASGIIQYLSFCVCLISVSIFSRSIHGISCSKTSLLFYYCIMVLCKYKSYFVHPFISWWAQAIYTFLLWIILLWTLVHKYLSPSFQFYLGVELLHHC